MSQVGFGYCVPEFQSRPDMRVPFIGVVAKNLHNYECHDKEKSRRDDGIIPSFGNGTPTMNAPGKWGLANAGYQLAYTQFDTSEGPISLPAQRDVAQYLPSVDTLHFLTQSQGSRLLPLPNKYYR